jgi:hypothetical protein
MSITVLPAASGDFDEWESELADPRVPPRHAARSTVRRQAIAESLGIRRHRTHEQEN